MQAQNTHGHSVQPQPVRATGQFEQLAHLSIQTASRAAHQARRLSGGLNAFARASQAKADAEETWEETDNVWAEAAAIDPLSESGEPIKCAHWYTLDSRRLLLLVYATGLQIWQVRADVKGSIDEIANIREDGILAARLTAASATARPHLIMAVAVADPPRTAIIKVVEINTQEILHSRFVHGHVLDMQVNPKVIAVACSAPPSILLLSTSTLEPIAGSPVLDVPHVPVFALSRGRSIAYASTLPSSDVNILAHNARWRTKSPERLLTSGNDPAQTVKRMVVASAKAIGGMGSSLLSATSAYSKSAPERHSSEGGAWGSSYVKVLDVITSQEVAHFKPTERSIAFLSFDPSGTALLTCSGEARAFQVFELRGPKQQVWHRYELVRGATPGRTEFAAWSEDGHFVGLTTARGTTHLYAISPFGGQADLASHFSATNRNEGDMLPLSIVLPAVARTKAPREPASVDGVYRDCSHAPIIAFTSAASPTVRDLALFYPHIGTLVHDRLSLIERIGYRAGVSGLTQLMRAPQTPVADLIVKLDHLSSCCLQRTKEWPETRSSLQPAGSASKPSVTRHAAQAELQTFSRSPRINPSSIYASHQFEFYTLPADVANADFTRGHLTVPSMKRLELKRHVNVTKVADNSKLADALLGENARAISRSPPSFPNAIAGARGPPVWQRTLQSLGQRSGSTSSPSTTHYSLSFDDDGAARDVDPTHTPNTEPVEREDLEDDCGWGFDDKSPTLLSPMKTSPAEASDDTPPFLMDEHRAEDALQVPSEPFAVDLKREASGKKKKRKDRRSPSPAALVGHSLS